MEEGIQTQQSVPTTQTNLPPTAREQFTQQEKQTGYFQSLAERYSNIDQGDGNQYIPDQGASEQVANEQVGSEQVTGQPPVGSEGNQPPEYDQDTMKKIEAIAMKERALLQQQQEFKRQQEEFQRKQEEIDQLKQKYGRYEKLEQLKDHDGGTSLLDEMGIDFQTLQEKYANDEIPTSRREAELMKKVSSLEEKIDNYFKTQEETAKQEEEKRKKQTEQERYNEYISDIDKIASEEKDEEGNLKYELLKNENAFDLVVKKVEQEYQKTGKIIDKKQAMDAVEKDLEEVLKRVVSYKKFGRYGQLKNQENNDQSFLSQTQQTNQYQPPTTLNNNFAANNPPPVNRPLSRQESLKRAAELIKFDD